MSPARQKTAPGDQFVRLTRDVLTSAAWRGLGINARRFIDFLMIEHLDHGGQANGFLLAPRRQLEAAGLGAQYISAAIEETERAGLVGVKRGVGKRPSTYVLRWLPLGKEPSRTPRGGDQMTYKGKSLHKTYDRKSSSTYKGKSQGPSDLQTEVTTAVPSTYKGKHLYRGSYRRGDNTSLSNAGVAPDIPGEPDTAELARRAARPPERGDAAAEPLVAAPRDRSRHDGKPLGAPRARRTIEHLFQKGHQE